MHETSGLGLVGVILAMCMGNMVAWLMALYSRRCAYNLLWNVAAGTAGAMLWGVIILWIDPPYATAGFILGGPVSSYLAIQAGMALRQRLGFRLDPHDQR